MFKVFTKKKKNTEYDMIWANLLVEIVYSAIYIKKKNAKHGILTDCSFHPESKIIRGETAWYNSHKSIAIWYFGSTVRTLDSRCVYTTLTIGFITRWVFLLRESSLGTGLERGMLSNSSRHTYKLLLTSICILYDIMYLLRTSYLFRRIWLRKTSSRLYNLR